MSNACAAVPNLNIVSGIDVCVLAVCVFVFICWLLGAFERRIGIRIVELILSTGHTLFIRLRVPRPDNDQRWCVVGMGRGGRVAIAER